MLSVSHPVFCISVFKFGGSRGKLLVSPYVTFVFLLFSRAAHFADCFEKHFRGELSEATMDDKLEHAVVLR